MEKDGLCTVETNIISQKILKNFGPVLIGRTLTVMVMQNTQADVKVVNIPLLSVKRRYHKCKGLLG